MGSTYLSRLKVISRWMILLRLLILMRYPRARGVLHDHTTQVLIVDRVSSVLEHRLADHWLGFAKWHDWRRRAILLHLSGTRSNMWISAFKIDVGCRGAVHCEKPCRRRAIG